MSKAKKKNEALFKFKSYKNMSLYKPKTSRTDYVNCSLKTLH